MTDRPAHQTGICIQARRSERAGRLGEDDSSDVISLIFLSYDDKS